MDTPGVMDTPLTKATPDTMNYRASALEKPPRKGKSPSPIPLSQFLKTEFPGSLFREENLVLKFGHCAHSELEEAWKYCGLFSEFDSQGCL